MMRMETNTCIRQAPMTTTQMLFDHAHQPELEDNLEIVEAVS